MLWIIHHSQNIFVRSGYSEKTPKKKPRERELCFLTFVLSHKRYFCKAAELSQGAEALLCAWQGWPHGTTYFGEKFCWTLYDDASGGRTHVMACTTSSSLMKDTHCSHKPLAGLCEPQKEARKNMPLTGAAQRGFTCQQFPHHCRISVKCHRHRRFFLLGSDILGQKTEREIPVLGMPNASLSIHYFQQEQCVPQTGNF